MEISGKIEDFTLLVAQGMQELFGEQLIALYLHGSAATGDFVLGRSDLDLIAIVQAALPVSEKAQLQSWFAENSPPPGLAGVDFELLTQRAAAFPAQRPDWDMIVRVQQYQHHFDILAPDASDGYSLLDLAVARERGRALVGPEPMTMIAAPPRLWLLQACAAQLQRWLGWDVINDRSGAVLTACRSWYYLSNDSHATKSEAGAWARSQSPIYAPLVEAALAQRRGEVRWTLENDEVKAFCQYVLRRLEES